MIGENAKDIGSASINDVFDILSKLKKDSEFGYEQQNTLEYAEKFKLSEEKYKKIKKNLESMELSQNIINKLLEVTPKNAELVKYIASTEGIEIDDEKINKILSEFKSE